ncbi:MAG: hypothetical protein U9R50_03720 [Campylobacterota bacterium]|nr:hypothetical protein [Campylobacterota bacterium]
MSSIFLSPEIFIELFLEFLLLLVLTFTLFQTFFILRYFKQGSTTELQYKLEKKSYLVGVAISVVLIFKIILVAFFTYSLDELSFIVPGAMCVAGVISSNDYGEPLLLLKLAILLFASLWLLVNRADTNAKKSLYFKKKMWFFIVLYIFILIEFLLSLKFFTLIETQNPVLCCSVIFREIDNPVPFNLSSFELLALFYTLYISVMACAYQKQKLALLVSSIVFTYISYYAIVYFFGTYIYELPTHKCPFCMLQKEYFYIGYFIYITLFLGVYYTFAAQFEFMRNSFKKVILFFTIFVLTLSAYFLIYIIRNGVIL